MKRYGGYLVGIAVTNQSALPSFCTSKDIFIFEIDLYTATVSHHLLFLTTNLHHNKVSASFWVYLPDPYYLGCEHAIGISVVDDDVNLYAVSHSLSTLYFAC